MILHLRRGLGEGFKPITFTTGDGFPSLLAEAIWGRGVGDGLIHHWVRVSEMTLHLLFYRLLLISYAQFTYF